MKKISSFVWGTICVVGFVIGATGVGLCWGELSTGKWEEAPHLIPYQSLATSGLTASIAICISAALVALCKIGETPPAKPTGVVHGR